MYTILKFLSRNLFKLFQNLSNRFQGIEIHKIDLLAVGGDEGTDFGVTLCFGDFRDLRIQKLHHDSVFQAESGVIDGAAKVENFTFIVIRCGNLLLRLYHTTSYPASDKTFSAFSKFSAFTRM